MNLSIVIFCYNEEGNLPKVIEQTLAVLPTIANAFEVIIVDDGSSDATPEIAKKSTEKFSTISYIRHPTNKGIGQALRTGYAAAKLEFVCAIPGDGQFDVNELSAIRPFGQSTYYSFYRVQTNYNFYRKSLTRINRLYNQHILGIYLRDVNWIKVYRKQQLDMVGIKLTSSLVESEICAKLYKHGALPIEIPSKYLDRNYGVSRGGSWSTLKSAIADLFFLTWTVFRHKPLI